MPTYVSLFNWTDQGIRNVRDTVQRRDQADALAEKYGASIEQVYWTVGPYREAAARIEFEPHRVEGPIGEALQELRSRCIVVHSGQWLITGREAIPLKDERQDVQLVGVADARDGVFRHGDPDVAEELSYGKAAPIAHEHGADQRSRWARGCLPWGSGNRHPNDR